MLSLRKIEFLLATLAVGVFAAPAVELAERQCNGCTPPPTHYPKSYCPSIKHVETFRGEPKQVAESCPGGTPSWGEGQSFETTWTLGAAIGLNAGEIVGGSAELSASVSWTVGSSTQIGFEEQCPDSPQIEYDDPEDVQREKSRKRASWACAILLYPQMQRISGEMVDKKPLDECKMGMKNKLGAFEFIAPLKRKDSGGFAVVMPTICSCPNYPGAKDPRAPKTMCPNDCTPDVPCEGTGGDLQRERFSDPKFPFGPIILPGAKGEVDNTNIPPEGNSNPDLSNNFQANTNAEPELVTNPQSNGNPEGLPGAQPEAVAEINPEVNPQAVPEVNPQVNPETNPEVKPEVPPETNPQVQPEVNPEVPPETNPQVQPEVNPQVPPEANPEVPHETMA